MYYLKLLCVMSIVCLSSLTPLFTYIGLNEMFDPNVCWTKVYSQFNPYIVLSSILLGIGITIRFDQHFLRFLGK